MANDPNNDNAQYRSLLRDKDVVDALRQRFASGADIPALGTLESAEVSEGQFEQMMESGPEANVPLNALEAIILLTGRPPLLIQDNDYLDPDLDELRTRLEPSRDLLKKAISSVGRLDVLRSHSRHHAGTAWMIEDDVMITNRHVAHIFSRARSGDFVFRRQPSGLPFRADVDFYREFERDTKLNVEIEEVLHIEPDEDGRPDLALVRVARNDQLPEPLRLASTAAGGDEDVVVIGYPGNAPRSNDPTALEQYFENIYGVKRLSPGKVSRAEPGRMLFNHDCTTLGGNSGSCVVRVATGEVVGLHFMGAPEENNWAVSAPAIRQRLSGLRRGSVSVPATPSTVGPKTPTPLEAEARRTADDLAERRGYDTEFLGERVPLPAPQGELASRVTPVENKPKGILDYTHYSVVMHRDRKLAIFTACNIDGAKAYRVRRGSDPWQTDPRIPDELQADNRLYRQNPLDRGHLVRRLDTAWGETREEAAEAALDTFFYTNAAPQHRRLNQQTWVNLEDYVLDNADNHDIKVTAFTGPVFRETDRDYRGFRIPEDFWKVLAFHNESTGTISATAYLLTQSDFLGDLEFVYGPYETYQVPIVHIENLTSLDFDFLSERDPRGVEERLEGAPPPGHLVETPQDLIL